MALPLNIDDLIHQRKVESARIEYKKDWNPEKVLHSVCAFANDIDNWGGGYIILGVEEKNGIPVLPQPGLFTSEHYDRKHVPHRKISPADVATFNSQYPKLAVRYNETFHDRFLIIDDKEIYLIGASLKDLGSKCFAFTQLDPGAIRGIKKLAFTQPSVQRTRPVACAVSAATIQKARM